MHGLAGSYVAEVSQEPAIQVSARVGVSSEASDGERSACKLAHVAVGRIHFLQGCWTEGPGSSRLRSAFLWAGDMLGIVSSRKMCGPLDSRESIQFCEHSHSDAVILE